MNRLDTRSTLRAGAAALMIALLAACASTPQRDPQLEQVKADLAVLRADPALTGRAQIAMQEATAAVAAADAADPDDGYRAHLTYIARQRVEIARAMAHRELAEAEFTRLTQARDQARLDARTREAQLARLDAQAAQRQALDAQAEADRIRAQAEADAQAMRLAMIELQAEATERGLILTLGDVLFETGRSELRPGGAERLQKLAAFLAENDDRTLVIEGHTDNVGGDAYNMDLSQRRADSVKAYLIGQRIDPSRIMAVGRGEGVPVASNDDAGGRQQNRRVEIIIQHS